MPIYNVEEYVERALLSALNQTFESIEYLLVDDKGTDGSMDVVRKIIAAHPRGKDVRIIDHGVNKGTGATKNSAMDYAQGEFLYLMDSDDEITPDCISILYEKMMETPVDFVAASFVTITTNDMSVPTVYQDMLIKSSDYGVAKAYYLENVSIAGFTWNKLYNLSFLRKANIRCKPHHLCEDLYFSYQVFLNARSCRLLSDSTYHYYKRGGNSASQNYDVEAIPRAGKELEEITLLKKDYAQRYVGTVFYSQLIKRIYVDARVHAVLNLYKSHLIPKPDKKRHYTVMLTYPIGFQQIMTLRAGKLGHLLMYFISKLPLAVKIRIFILRRRIV